MPEETRPERFATQPREVRIGKVDDQDRFRPFTVAELKERGIDPDSYDMETGYLASPADPRV